MRRLLRKFDKMLRPGRLGKILNPNTYPINQWYREHIERNFDIVCLGDSRYINKVSFPDTIRGFDWSLREQNLKWDFNVLKHFFSILKPGGVAVFPLTGSFVRDLSCRTSLRRYYLPMMPYYLSDSTIKRTYIRICKRLPFMAIRPSDLLPSGRSGGGNLYICSVEDWQSADSLISDICLFCLFLLLL